MRMIASVGAFTGPPGNLLYGFVLRDAGEGADGPRYAVHRLVHQEDGKVGHDTGGYYDSSHFAWQEFQFRVSQAINKDGMPDPLFGGESPVVRAVAARRKILEGDRWTGDCAPNLKDRLDELDAVLRVRV